MYYTTVSVLLTILVALLLINWIELNMNNNFTLTSQATADSFINLLN